MTLSSLTVNRHLAVFALGAFTKSRCLTISSWWASETENIYPEFSTAEGRGHYYLCQHIYMHNSTVSTITWFNTILLTLEIITFFQKQWGNCIVQFCLLRGFGTSRYRRVKSHTSSMTCYLIFSLTRSLVPFLCPQMYRLSERLARLLINKVWSKSLESQ